VTFPVNVRALTGRVSVEHAPRDGPWAPKRLALFNGALGTGEWHMISSLSADGRQLLITVPLPIADPVRTLYRLRMSAD
jgi:hypothetical protein